MIPKIIHYCWFGKNELPPLARKCINSWRKFFPDYEIKEWNEDNFDVNIIPYTAEAYQCGKYAFVSDYARFWILYRYGGVYFDTDVEVIRSMDDIINLGSFMGCENDFSQKRATNVSVAPGLGLGATPGLDIYKEILDMYSVLHFIKPDGTCNLTTVVNYTSDILYNHNLKNINGIQKCGTIWIYPKEYFCPLFGRYINFTENTKTIHHYSGSWTQRGIKKKFIWVYHKIIRYIVLRGFVKSVVYPKY